MIRLLTIALLLLAFMGDVWAQGKQGKLLPEFTATSAQEWINSEPLTVKDLRGKVLLIDVWTFACWNCYRSFPWLNKLEKDLENKGFQVIGIHSPEFEYERSAEKVQKKVEEFQLKHPVMLDNSFAYWRALKNNAWPTYYVVDKKGVIRGKFVGETHDQTPRDQAIRKLVAELLKEE